jgi:hypothetical protein
MANVAAVFHWPTSELKALTVDDLLGYHAMAVERSKVSQQS